MQLNIIVPRRFGPLMARGLRACLLLSSFLLLAPGMDRANAVAPYAADIGYTELASQLGASTPDGSGIRVQHVEATASGSGFIDYRPDPAVFGGAYVIDQPRAIFRCS